MNSRFALFLSTCCFCGLSPLFAAPVEVNGIAAKVNGRVVTKNQVSFMLAPIYSQLSTQFPRRGADFEKQMRDAHHKVIQELVDRQIILSEFKQLGAQMKPNAVNEEVKRQISELYHGDEAKFREELKKSRLTMEGYREMTSEKLIVQAMRAAQFADSPPPLPSEIQAEYAKAKASMRDASKDKITFQKIFIPRLDPENLGSTAEDQLKIAEGLMAKIQKGEDFTELAKKHSKDAFATTGGLQEDIPRTDLAPEFANIIFDAEEDKAIGPLQDQSGFLIVKTTKKTLGPSPELSKVREQMDERVRKNKNSAQYEKWIEARRKSAMIDIKEKNL